MSTDPPPPLMIVAPGPDPISCKLLSIETPPTYVPGPILIVSPLFAAATAGAIWVYEQPLLQTLSVAADAGAAPEMSIAVTTKDNRTRTLPPRLTKEREQLRVRGVAPRSVLATTTALLRQRFIVSPSHCGSNRLVRITTRAGNTPAVSVEGADSPLSVVSRLHVPAQGTPGRSTFSRTIIAVQVEARFWDDADARNRAEFC